MYEKLQSNLLSLMISPIINKKESICYISNKHHLQIKEKREQIPDRDSTSKVKTQSRGHSDITHLQKNPQNLRQVISTVTYQMF